MYDRKKIQQCKLDSPLQRCVANRPLRGNPGQRRAKLNIFVQGIDKKSAQIVLIQVISSSTTELEKAKRLIAKIYDPLYFDHEQDDVNPFPAVDLVYTHEAAAYEKLKPLQGRIIPRYIASYSLSWPVNKNRSCDVRLILLDFVPGTLMQRLEPAKNPPKRMPGNHEGGYRCRI